MENVEGFVSGVIIVSPAGLSEPSLGILSGTGLRGLGGWLDCGYWFRLPHWLCTFGFAGASGVCFSVVPSSSCVSVPAGAVGISSNGSGVAADSMVFSRLAAGRQHQRKCQRQAVYQRLSHGVFLLCSVSQWFGPGGGTLPAPTGLSHQDAKAAQGFSIPIPPNMKHTDLFLA